MSLAYRQIPAALAARKTFTGNSLSARVTAWPTHGILPGLYRGILTEHAEQARERGASLYVVYSYATPIAWVATDEHAAYVPDVRYSRTTSRGQSLVRQWAATESGLISAAS